MKTTLITFLIAVIILYCVYCLGSAGFLGEDDDVFSSVATPRGQLHDEIENYFLDENHDKTTMLRHISYSRFMGTITEDECAALNVRIELNAASMWTAP